MPETSPIMKMTPPVLTATPAHVTTICSHGGTGRPAFSLHPPHRNAEFYRRLPELVARTEADDFPADQRGCYDVNSSLIDWSAQIAALETRRWWRVLLARARRR